MNRLVALFGQLKDNGKNRSKSGSHATSTRRLRLESLEERALLAVTTGTEPVFPAPTGAEFVVTTLADIIDDTDGVLSLREAIDAASAGDTITFDSSLSGEKIKLSGTQLTIDKTIFINASNLANGITIDGNQESRVFDITGGSENSPVELINLTITGGSDWKGGGIYNNNGALTLTSCSVTGNSATSSSDEAYGGGINNNGGILTLINCSVTENTVRSSDGFTYALGGGIYSNKGAITLTNCVVSDNSAVSVGFDGSYAFGGGIYNSNGSLTMTNCAVTDNITKARSGFRNTMGGGIYNGGAFTMTNCSVAGNSTRSIDYDDEESESGTYAGGIYNGNGGELTIYNSIVALNTSESGNDIYEYPSAMTYGYNTLSSFEDWDDWSPNPPFIYDSSLPLFTDAENGDYSLAEDSQAIDVGNNNLIAGVTTDLAGNPRIVNDVVDLGAYEFQGGIPTPTDMSVVTTLDDTYDDTDDVVSLREAILFASEGDTITFDPSLSGETITLSNGQLTISEGITIDASSLEDGITIDANQLSRVFNITGGSEENPVNLVNLTITKGKVTDDNGGGIYNSGVLTITNCQVTGNEATNAGGGIYNFGALTINVTDSGASTFSGNTASGGGAIFNSSANCVISDVTFSDNTAGTNGGGAIYNTHSSDAISVVTITGCDFTGNTTTGCGGAIDNWGNMTISGGEFTSNEATSGNGGAIHNGDPLKAVVSSQSISLSLSEVEFYSNTASFGGAVMSSATLTIANCDFGGVGKGNIATGEGTGGALSIGLNGDVTFQGTNTFVENSAYGAGAFIVGGDLAFSDGAKLTFTDNSITGLDPDYGANILYNKAKAEDYPEDWSIYISGDADAECEKIKPFRYTQSASSPLTPISASKLFADQALATEDAVLYLDVDGSGNFVEVGKSFSAAELGLTSGESEMDFLYVTGSGSIGGTLRLNVGDATPEISSVASAGVNRHQIAWSAIDGAKGYELAFSTDQENWSSVITSETAFTVSGLTYGEKVYYKVRGTSGDLSSSWSESSSLVVCPMDINGDGIISPADLTTFSLAMNSRRGDSRWDARCDVNGDGIVSASDLTYISMNWLSRSTSEKLTFPTTAAEIADVTTLDLDLSFVEDADAEDSLFEAIF